MDGRVPRKPCEKSFFGSWEFLFLWITVILAIIPAVNCSRSCSGMHL